MKLKEIREFIESNIKFYESEVKKFDESDPRRLYWVGRLQSYKEMLRCMFLNK